MSSAHPLTDGLLWLRWFAGAVAIVGLPGYLLVGFWLRSVDWPTRIVLSWSLGLFAVAAFGLGSSTLGIAASPFHFALATLALLACSIALRARWGGACRELVEPLSPLGAGQGLVLVLAGVVLLALVLRAFAGESAPAHVHDASNHAYLALRAAQLETIRPSALFEGEAGQPPVLYLAGWHLTAALIARVGGVAPYVSAWYTVVVALAAVPLALSVLWRLWNPAPAVAVIAGCFVASNQLAPSGALGWGGFGQILGFQLVATLVLLLRGLLARPSVALAIATGVALAAQFAIHGSEVLVALLLLLPVATRTWPRATWSRLAMAFAIAGLLVGPAAWQLTHAYAVRTESIGPNVHYGFGDALERLWAAGGKADALKALTLLGLGFGFARAESRRVAWLMAGLAAYYFAAGVVQDRVSLWLATPFYQQPPRILYLQIYVLPPLMALPVVAGWSWLRARAGRMRALAVVSLVVFAACASAWPGQIRSLRNARVGIPFGASGYRLARELATRIDPDAVVANFWDDGSTWAMHVSGVRFLQPCSWHLSDDEGPLRPRVEGLLAHPWPDQTRALRARGVAYLWVSRRAWPDPSALPGSVEQFDDDPRFEVVGREEEAVVYRIRWDWDA